MVHRQCSENRCSAAQTRLELRAWLDSCAFSTSIEESLSSSPNLIRVSCLARVKEGRDSGTISPIVACRQNHSRIEPVAWPPTTKQREKPIMTFSFVEVSLTDGPLDRSTAAFVLTAQTTTGLLCGI